MEGNLEKFYSPIVGNINYIKKFDNGVSIYTILASSALEIISKFKFAKQDHIFSAPMNQLIELLQKLPNDYPDHSDTFNGFRNILNFVLELQNIKQSFEYIHLYANHPEYSKYLDLFCKFIVHDGCPNLHTKVFNEFNHEMVDEILTAFSNALHIKIVSINSTIDKKEFCLNLPGKYPIVHLIIKNNSYFLGYTEKLKMFINNPDTYLLDNDLSIHIINEENKFIPSPNFTAPYVGNSPQPAHYLSNCQSDPYSGNLPQRAPNVDNIDQSAPPNISNERDIPKLIDLDKRYISKRTNISALKLDQRILDELKIQYCHCIGIGTKNNQIRAFAVSLIEELKLDSNAEFKKDISKRFEENKSFTKLQFDKIYKISTKVKKLKKVLKEIYRIALTRLDQIEDCEDLFIEDGHGINNELSQDPMEIKILSKIFGVNSIIISQNSDTEFEMFSINSPSENLRLQLHFIAIKVSYMQHMHVLITNSHNYEDQFNIYKQECEGNRQLFIKKSRFINQRQNNYSDSTAYFQELSNVSTMILNIIHKCIQDKTFINLPIDNLRYRINNLRSRRPENFEIEEPNIFRDEIISFCQLCEVCGQPNPNFVNKVGCYFHEACLENIFKE